MCYSTPRVPYHTIKDQRCCGVVRAVIYINPFPNPINFSAALYVNGEMQAESQSNDYTSLVNSMRDLVEYTLDQMEMTGGWIPRPVFREVRV